VKGHDLRALAEALARIASAARRLPDHAFVELRPESYGLLGGALFAALAGAPFGIVTLHAARFVELRASAIVLGVSVGVALAVFALLRSSLRRTRPSTTSHRRAFDIGLASALLVGTLLILAMPRANAWLDRSRAVERAAIIEGFSRNKAGGIASVCVVAASGTRECIVFKPMVDDAFQLNDVESPVAIAQRRGALGLPWIERVRHSADR
jgi:hypothetical protein